MMRCLLVRQPYASLISQGFKRIEFRSRDCKIRESVIIASSKGPSIKTKDPDMNLISDELPKGKLLSLVNIESSSFLTHEDLKGMLNGSKIVCINKKNICIANEPLGEPILDIIDAINNRNWWAYGWNLSALKIFDSPIEYSSKAYGSWVNLNKTDSINIDSYL